MHMLFLVDTFIRLSLRHFESMDAVTIYCLGPVGVLETEDVGAELAVDCAGALAVVLDCGAEHPATANISAAQRMNKIGFLIYINLSITLTGIIIYIYVRIV